MKGLVFLISEWSPQVVTIEKVGKHPNANSLSITHVLGNYPVIFRTDDFKEGDLAGYIPIDSLVPNNTVFSFLFEEKDETVARKRIKSKKIRGIFSMGMLTRLPNMDGEPFPHIKEGDSIVTLFDLKKYEPPIERGNFLRLGIPVPHPKTRIPVPIYDVEGLRRYPDLIGDDTYVSITEKVHGTNARFVYLDGNLYVGSHNNWVDPDGESVWARIAREYGLYAILEPWPGYVLYGEIYGYGVQKLNYGLEQKKLICFDVFETTDQNSLGWWSPALTRAFCIEHNLDYVPMLYEGYFSLEIAYDLSNGNSVIPGSDHTREGIVIRPTTPQYSEELEGNLVLKLIGENYLLNKNS